MNEIKNARITGTMLGTEDHGGYVFDSWDEVTRRRVGVAYGCEFILGVLRAVGVGSWEKLIGAHVRIETEGWGGRALRIGHIYKDQWFDPKALADSMRDQEPAKV